MQTESLFRAARVLETVHNTIDAFAPSLTCSFHAHDGKLFVVLTGVAEKDMPNKIDRINSAALLPSTHVDDRFKLIPSAPNVWEVEAA